MNSAHIIPALLAAGVAVSAAITDATQRRIPNRLTYPAMLAGLVLQMALHGWRGLLLSAGGGLLFGGLFILFYLVRAMGAGDVKLAAALGCLSDFPRYFVRVLCTHYPHAGQHPPEHETRRGRGGCIAARRSHYC